MSYAYNDEENPAGPKEPLRLLLVEERFDFLFGVLRRFMPDSWMPFLEHFGSQLKGRKVVRITIEAVE